MFYLGDLLRFIYDELHSKIIMVKKYKAPIMNISINYGYKSETQNERVKRLYKNKCTKIIKFT